MLVSGRIDLYKKRKLFDVSFLIEVFQGDNDILEPPPHPGFQSPPGL